MIGTITPAPAPTAPMILATGTAPPAAINAPAASTGPRTASPAMATIEEQHPTAPAIMVTTMLEYRTARHATISARPVFPVQPIVRAAMGTIEDQPLAAHALLAIMIQDRPTASPASTPASPAQAPQLPALPAAPPPKESLSPTPVPASEAITNRLISYANPATTNA